MKALHKRLDVIERNGSATLSPAIKQWLGQHLTPDEQSRLADDTGTDRDDIDTSGWSREVKEWLGVD